MFIFRRFFQGVSRYYPIKLSSSNLTLFVGPTIHSEARQQERNLNSKMMSGATTHPEALPPSLCCPLQGPEGGLPPSAAARLQAVRPAAPQRPAGHHHPHRPDPQVPPHSTQGVSTLVSHLNTCLSLKGAVCTVGPLPVSWREIFRIRVQSNLTGCATV